MEFIFCSTEGLLEQIRKFSHRKTQSEVIMCKVSRKIATSVTEPDVAEFAFFAVGSIFVDIIIAVLLFRDLLQTRLGSKTSCSMYSNIRCASILFVFKVFAFAIARKWAPSAEMFSFWMITFDMLTEIINCSKVAQT